MISIVSKIGGAAFNFILEYIRRNDSDLAQDLCSAIFFGGIIGAAFFIPAYVIIQKNNIPRKYVQQLFWACIIAGIVGGFYLAIPAGIAAFVYTNNLSNKGGKH
jgi:hypothetical protein